MSQEPRDPRFVVGEARVRAALDHVQQAQVELSRAMADLSSVIGYIPEGDALSKLYDRVRSVWYRIDAKLKSGPTKRYPEINRLDRAPEPGEADDPHARGCGYRGWRTNYFSPPPLGVRLAPVGGDRS